jgi:hypothetical protein
MKISIKANFSKPNEISRAGIDNLVVKVL